MGSVLVSYIQDFRYWYIFLGCNTWSNFSYVKIRPSSTNISFAWNFRIYKSLVFYSYDKQCWECPKSFRRHGNAPLNSNSYDIKMYSINEINGHSLLCLKKPYKNYPTDWQQKGDSIHRKQFSILVISMVPYSILYASDTL